MMVYRMMMAVVGSNTVWRSTGDPCCGEEACWEWLHLWFPYCIHDLRDCCRVRITVDAVYTVGSCCAQDICHGLMAPIEFDKRAPAGIGSCSPTTPGPANRDLKHNARRTVLRLRRGRRAKHRHRHQSSQTKFHATSMSIVV